MAMWRRQFLILLGSALAARPSRLLAQGSKEVPKIGFLLGLANDAEAQARVRAFEEEMRKEGWTPGRDVQIEYRFAGGDAQRMKALAKELVGLQPSVIVGHSTPVITELAQATKTIPIVFVVVADPVGSGFAKGIAHPGGNITGFTNLDPTITGKLLSTLREMRPDLGSASLLFNPDTAATPALLRVYVDAFEAAASSVGITPAVIHVRDPADIERGVTDLGGKPRPGLIVMPDNFTTVHRKLIVSLAAKHRIATIYPYRYFVEDGGLISYGVDVKDLFRRAPQYVSRILRGANPADLPIQAPTKFELVINLKTAKSLDLAVPKIMLASADALLE
jgi:putative tryptophan/tyrosine transport system substrate-binding protein